MCFKKKKQAAPAQPVSTTPAYVPPAQTAGPAVLPSVAVKGYAGGESVRVNSSNADGDDAAIRRRRRLSSSLGL